ncbi:MAG: PEP-CTERM sorting domain-containing protein [Fimbriimonadaceae bacterium]|nr:PEP-CTERM sorting domain-containing protein [Fimbriimonadaceae bacterium]
MNKGLLIACALIGASAASAQLTSVGPFSGTAFESWETQPVFQFLPSYSAFGGSASVNQIGPGQGVHITTGWGFFNSIFPYDSAHFLGGAGVNYAFDFNTPAMAFGGYWGTNADAAGATAKFFDANNNQIDATQAIGAPIGQWQWNGWTSTVGIKRVEIYANNGWGGFIMSDALQYSAVPEPATLAVLGLGIIAVVRRRRK